MLSLLAFSVTIPVTYFLDLICSVTIHSKLIISKPQLLFSHEICFLGKTLRSKGKLQRSLIGGLEIQPAQTFLEPMRRYYENQKTIGEARVPVQQFSGETP